MYELGPRKVAIRVKAYLVNGLQPGLVTGINVSNKDVIGVHLGC